MLQRFQLTTSRRGRPCLKKAKTVRKYFNSRPHEEVDIGIPLSTVYLSISTHDLTKRSTLASSSWLYPSSISTHDLTKRSTFFRCLFSVYINISTHDLTKRSTNSMNRSPFFLLISTHDLTKRSTSLGSADGSNLIFQLTTSRRGRLYRKGTIKLPGDISTHDLTKRSTTIR